MSSIGLKACCVMQAYGLIWAKFLTDVSQPSSLVLLWSRCSPRDAFDIVQAMWESESVNACAGPLRLSWIRYNDVIACINRGVRLLHARTPVMVG